MNMNGDDEELSEVADVECTICGDLKTTSEMHNDEECQDCVDDNVEREDEE